METDRTDWGVREYADALNRAATPADLFELVEEVNEKWAGAEDLEPESDRRDVETLQPLVTRASISTT
jgi:hypothetical protein